MDKDELKTRIKALSAEIAKLGAERTEAQTALAHLSAPFKVGDRVMQVGGKEIYQIKRIGPGWLGSANLYGSKIKKDGTPGAVCSQLYEYRGWIKAPT